LDVQRSIHGLPQQIAVPHRAARLRKMNLHCPIPLLRRHRAQTVIHHPGHTDCAFSGVSIIAGHQDFPSRRAEPVVLHDYPTSPQASAKGVAAVETAWSG